MDAKDGTDRVLESSGERGDSTNSIISKNNVLLSYHTIPFKLRITGLEAGPDQVMSCQLSVLMSVTASDCSSCYYMSIEL